MKVMMRKMLFLMVIFINWTPPQFNKVKRSQYGNGCDFKHEIIEYRGKNCYIPTKGYCFVNCINFFNRLRS